MYPGRGDAQLIELSRQAAKLHPQTGVWEASTGELVSRRNLEGTGRALATDGSHVAAFDPEGSWVLLVDIKTGEERRFSDDELRVTAVALDWAALRLAIVSRRADVFVMDTKVEPVGRVSVRTTFWAVLGPVLNSVMV